MTVAAKKTAKKASKKPKRDPLAPERISELLERLQQAYPGADLRADVLEFFETAYARRWIAIAGW